MSCVKCGVMRDVVACINDVANIKRDLKCGVHVSNVKWGARCQWCDTYCGTSVM